MTRLIITRGLPGCGKTTFARAWVAEDREHRARAVGALRARLNEMAAAMKEANETARGE